MQKRLLMDLLFRTGLLLNWHIFFLQIQQQFIKSIIIIQTEYSV